MAKIQDNREMGCPAPQKELDLNAKVEGGEDPRCPLTGGLQCALTETRESVIRMEAKLDDVNELKKEVWGNGKPGLKSEVQRLCTLSKILIWVLAIVGGALTLDATSRMITTLAPKPDTHVTGKETDS